MITKTYFIILIILLFKNISYVQAEEFAPCTPPIAGSWLINTDCELTSSAVIRGNIFVRNNATLTINAGIDLVIDLNINRIEIEDGSHIVIKNSGLIHSLMIDDTDGRVGYYLKEVNGPVLRKLNHTTSFYPASTIKVLEHAYALSRVQVGSASLTSSVLTVCPGSKTNCDDLPNSNATCDTTFTLSETLSTALRRMMVNSDNQSTNAVQEFFGNGTPSVGRFLMNLFAANTLGLSNQTVLRHKFACGNISNDPFNTATLADLAEIYEEVGENDDVLGGPSRSSFYSLMINQSSFNNGLTSEINDIIDEENIEIGLSIELITNFKNSINSARKAGNVTCCFSNAGWVELPLNNGATSKQYVFATFIDDFSTNNVAQNEVAAEMMRKPIREALQSWD